ncbi:helix-turn-helix domain-containing GNAT family N-acetyltransferase [Pseudomonas gingeri]|uniref:helix-turn-helix domain-containing GNAT family N-acetyltransferase n=1 Tax=Pseudomonas gingeri TaxID=117681 RepID=UPI0015A04840|nr:helix-turn-helix domain-containing GNAT family N-acetyltransferase [Pseudomonas gingeri]NWA02301.1 MarR family transcriptional regulator [Pseudomonas gingeri]NWA12526.1 MarR family transcriptional regulator [Pseudomonas gingeri]NWA57068.1 MarR family transcriptional regulator [Pseudomonas gingeri]NWA93411.1 MarR family transcriptional regulator [Pseudomonas gingeri]NWB02883.1 MarR family transcriptional regulator [Pseudomonas gingeri]
MSTDPSLVEEIRSASRTMVRELGFMRATLAGTDYSASAVHALLEVEAAGAMTAARLVQVLGLEKSSVSRMMGKLIDAGELRETLSAEDARAKQLLLTEQGRQTVAHIHRHGRLQVSSALEHLNPSQQQAVAQGLAAYARALGTSRLDSGEVAPRPITLSAGYRPGLVGRVAEMHAAFYSRHYGFGQFFESKIALGIAEFAGRLEQPCNRIWAAIHNERIVGSIAIDGQDLGNNEAHLRWFILDDGCRGSGIGRQLLGEALAFCDRFGFCATQLWTFKGLDAARQLYEAQGFQLTQEQPGNQWGSTVTEQQFTRRLIPATS